VSRENVITAEVVSSAKTVYDLNEMRRGRGSIVRSAAKGRASWRTISQTYSEMACSFSIMV